MGHDRRLMYVLWRWDLPDELGVLRSGVLGLGSGVCMPLIHYSALILWALARGNGAKIRLSSRRLLDFLLAAASPSGSTKGEEHS